MEVRQIVCLTCGRWDAWCRRSINFLYRPRAEVVDHAERESTRLLDAVISLQEKRSLERIQAKMEKECWLKSWKFLRKRTNDRRKVCFGPRSPTTKPRSRWKPILPSSSFNFTDDKSLPMATERNNNALASRTRVFVKVCMCVRVYMCWHITDPV